MSYESNSIFWVEVEKIVPNPFQPRREFDQSKLHELSESIRMYGVLQPLVVTRKEVQLDDGAFRTEYELIAGERRLRASKLAGLREVPVIIRSGEETELMKLELAIIENLQREDLNPVDRAMAFSQLANVFGLSHSEVARKVGRSREYVSNSIRLLLLPDTIISALSQREISDGHARTLLMLNDRPEEQDVVFREILLKKLSVREVEKISRKIATDKVRKKSWADSDPELIEIEKQFTESLGTRVQISKTDYGGKIVIDYFSPEDLQKLLEMVHKEAVAHDAAVALASIAAATPLAAVTSVNDSVPTHMAEDPEMNLKEWESETDKMQDFEMPIPEIEVEAPTVEDVFDEHAFSEPYASVPVPPAVVAVPHAAVVPDIVETEEPIMTSFEEVERPAYPEVPVAREEMIIPSPSTYAYVPSVPAEPLHVSEPPRYTLPTIPPYEVPVFDEPPVAPEPVPKVEEVPASDPAPKADDDASLYSIRNFSL